MRLCMCMCQGEGEVVRTLFKFPSNRAYSSRTSCSRGERVSASSGDGLLVGMGWVERLLFAPSALIFVC
jgi:hypothetical protein